MSVATSPARAPRRTAGLAGRLNAEWTAEVESQVDAALPRWARREPALDLPDAAALEQAAAQRDNDAVLRALLRVHRGGDVLAGRTLLQLLLGVAVGLARRTCHHVGGDREESEARAVAELLDLLGSVPLTTGARVADRLALDLLSRLTRGSVRRADERCVGGALDVEEAAAESVRAHRSHDVVGPPPGSTEGAGEGRADLVLLDVLVSGTRAGAIGKDEARLLWDVHSPAGDGSMERLAALHGMAAPALRQRVSRARRRLVGALAAPSVISAA